MQSMPFVPEQVDLCPSMRGRVDRNGVESAVASPNVMREAVTDRTKQLTAMTRRREIQDGPLCRSVVR